MPDKSDRRAQEEGVVKSLNALAVGLGLDGIPVRSSQESVCAFFASLCEHASTQECQQGLLELWERGRGRAWGWRKWGSEDWEGEKGPSMLT